MAFLNSYKDLIVWQKSIDLVLEIYKLTELFPKSELYGLSFQMRRSSVSISSNIAEGSRRGTRKEYRRFLEIAFGSGAELETQIHISKRLGIAKDYTYLKVDCLIDESMRILNVLINKLKD